MKKKLAAVLGLGAVGGILVWLATRGGAKPVSQVALRSNPVNTVLLIDGKHEYATPQVITLPNGPHTFKAVSKTPDYLTVTYGFDYWALNGVPISEREEVLVNIAGPATITAQYRLYQAGRYPAIPI